MKRADLLVEIGCEELPPKTLFSFAQNFSEYLLIELAKTGLIRPGETETRFFCSPRRLAVCINDVPLQTETRVVERTGPAVSQAFDETGNPTPAALGFAKSCGVELDALGKTRTKRGEQLTAEVKLKGKPATALVPDALRATLKSLPISKRMRWGTGDVLFARPVHWVVLLHGKEVIDAEILGVKTGRETLGHRFHAPGPIIIKKPSDYPAVLESKGKVRVNDAEHSLINRLANDIGHEAAKLDGIALGADHDSALLQEVAALLEWPVVMVGEFSKKYLELPDEVLITTLQVHQRYFPVHDHHGNLLANFITFANLESRHPEVVQKGNERVVVPRLEDAMFFLNSDLKTSLQDRREQLARVTFQQGLGSLADKSGRLQRLASDIAEQIRGNPDLADRAAALAKCDLLTDMVGEFPELQGVMGEHYARADNEPAEVCKALGEQYLPRFAGDTLPKTHTGMALALADKVDMVCGVFLLGKLPSGSKDPFGLRRAALGALRIAIECELDLDFTELIGNACGLHLEQNSQLKEKGESPYQKILIYSFFRERLGAYYEEKGIRVDVFQAIDENAFKGAGDWSRPLDFDSRMTGLQSFIALPEADNLIAANKRIKNILPDEWSETGEPEPALFAERAEQTLYDAIEDVAAKVAPLVEKRDYRAAFKKLAKLRAPVDEFFDAVLVMADDEQLKRNRLALLSRLYGLFRQFADLSLLQTG